jgi:hypothetical protein
VLLNDIKIKKSSEHHSKDDELRYQQNIQKAKIQLSEAKNA